MERPQHQQAGFRSGEGELNGVEVSHFPHQDHVGVFPQRGPQTRSEALHVKADLSLVDQALALGVNELDGILEGNDVVVLLFVDQVDHGCQGRRFSGSGGPCDQDKTGLLPAQHLNRLGQHEFPQGFDHGRNEPKSPPVTSPFDENVGPETSLALHFISEINIFPGLQQSQLLFFKQLQEQDFNLLR